MRSNPGRSATKAANPAISSVADSATNADTTALERRDWVGSWHDRASSNGSSAVPVSMPAALNRLMAILPSFPCDRTARWAVSALMGPDVVCMPVSRHTTFLNQFLVCFPQRPQS
ncbi:MAG TPA: hypothetical protein VG298_14965 [Acidimicrobiales bacterium]|nr:hypothetical protein [Acidimicrobiales bacterium]